MKCKVCGVRIKSTQYTGLGEFEKVCHECAKDIIKSKMPIMRLNHLIGKGEE
jgi:transposase-like protein